MLAPLKLLFISRNTQDKLLKIKRKIERQLRDYTKIEDRITKGTQHLLH